MTFDFYDAAVLVTGAGSGIGRAVAMAFHAAGARVALGDVNPETVAETAAELGDRAFGAVVDVRDEAAVQEFFAAAERALGPAGIVVANAGVFPNCPVVDMAVAEWDRVMEINLRGTFLICREAARRMIANGSAGRIVTMASGAHASARLGGSHYCASKAGIVMFTKTLAMELAGHGITVNNVAPGYINTRGDAPPADSAFNDAMLRNIPSGRFGTPAEIGEAVMYLASAGANYITGEVLAVNGGAFAGRAYLPLNRPAAR